MAISSNENWTIAYAKQALSDLEIREILVDNKVNKCHRLHYLQMASEKVCKAYLSRANGHEEVKKKHNYVEKNLPIIARHYYSVLHSGNQIPSWEFSYIKKIARDIELLAPACHADFTREDNTEYPWLSSSGELLTPSEYDFPEIDDMHRNILRLMRLIRRASEDLVVSSNS